MTTLAIPDVKILETIEDVEDNLNFKASKHRNNHPEMILRLVEYYGGIPRADFTARNSERQFVIRRQIVAMALTIYTDLNQHEIGKYIKRNRTIVSYSIRLHENYIVYDKEYRNLYVKVASSFMRLNNKYEHIPSVDVVKIVEMIKSYEKNLKDLQEFLVTITFLKKKSDDPNLFTTDITS